VEAPDGDAGGEAVENLDASDLAGHCVEKSYTRNLLKASEGFDRRSRSGAIT
jgi:hypothetical protein